jgi:hypothetical protein
MSQIETPYSAEVLAQRARDIAKQLGYTTPPLDSAGGFEWNDEYLEYLDHAGGEHPDWDLVMKHRPTLLQYWRRQSPNYLVATDIHSSALTPGIVSRHDPPPTLSGMTSLTLDPEGRLLRFAAIPPQKEGAPTPAQAYDWKQLFALAGLDLSQFQSTEPMWNSLGSADQRAAWTGVWPGTSMPLRVEAAAWHGKPVFFRLIGDWTEPDRMPSSDSTHSKAPEIALVVFLLILMAAAVWLARHNSRTERSDPQGALRLGLLIFILQMLLWTFSSHFVTSISLFGLFVQAASYSLFLAAVAYVVYLAIEPYVRRHWPHAIISWSRLMAGRIRDPLVGRDTLYGVILGVSWAVIFGLMSLGLKRIGATPVLGSQDFLEGPRHVLGQCLWHVTNSVEATLMFFFLMFVFRVIFRKPWIAAAVFVIFWVGIKSYDNHHWYLTAPAFVAVYAIAAFVVLRFGFVALAVGILTVDLLGSVPVTTDWSSFYSGAQAFVILLVAAMALWGCYTALAGQKLLKGDLFE